MSKYKKYLRSADWRKIRNEKVEEKNGKCECCGSTRNIEVHHKTYANIFKEKLSDLKVVCRNCHLKEHNRVTPFQKKIRKLEKKKRKRKARRRL